VQKVAVPQGEEGGFVAADVAADAAPSVPLPSSSPRCAQAVKGLEQQTTELH